MSNKKIERLDLTPFIGSLPLNHLGHKVIPTDYTSFFPMLGLLTPLDNLTDLIMILDKEGNIIFSNQNIFSWQGTELKTENQEVKTDKSPPKKIYELLKQDHITEIEKAFAQAASSRESICLTGRLFRKQQNLTDCFSLVINSVNPFTKNYPTHPAVLFVVIAKNVTKQEALQDFIYKAEQEKTLILNTLNEYIILQNKNSEIIWANQSALDSAGLTETEIIGKRCFDIWGNKKTICSNCSVQKAIQTGEPHEFEHISPDKHNWIIKGSPFRSRAGEIIGAVEITRDITLLKRQDRQLRLTQFSIDNFTEPVYWLAADGSFVYVNNAAVKFLGYSKTDFEQLHVYEIDPSLSQTIWNTFWKRFSLSGFYNIITEQKKKDNQLVQVEITMHYLHFEGEEYCFAVAKDLTEHKHAESERHRLEEQLYHANRLETIGQVAASIAHDFSNLLTSIRTYSQLLLTSADNQTPIQDDIREIQRAIDHGSGLIQQLLTLGNKQQITPVVFNLNEFITNLQGMIKNILSRQIDFKFISDPALHNIKIDLRQMDQLLFNLVINARDAMPQKGQFIITTENIILTNELYQNHSFLQSGAYVKLSLKDTGAGIDEELKEKIFEPFFTTKEQGKGTGLGLAIADVIVKQNNGLITIDSEKGKGTRFDIFFPAFIEKENKRTADHAEAATAEPTGGKKSVILVIEAKAVRELIKEILESNNFDIMVVNNTEEALKSQKYTKKLDIMLTSYFLPTMNAYSFYEKMKFLYPQLKLVIIMESEKERLSIPKKMVDYPFIFKPYRRKKIIQTINDVLEGTTIINT